MDDQTSLVHNGQVFTYLGQLLNQNNNNNNNNNKGNCLDEDGLPVRGQTISSGESTVVPNIQATDNDRLRLIGRQWTKRDWCTTQTMFQFFAVDMSSTPSVVLRIRMVCNSNIDCSSETSCYGLFHQDCVSVEGISDTIYTVDLPQNTNAQRLNTKRGAMSPVADERQTKRTVTPSSAFSKNQSFSGASVDDKKAVATAHQFELETLMFDVFEFAQTVDAQSGQDSPMAVAVLEIFQQHDLIRKFNLDRTNLIAFANKIHQGMTVSQNQYHNEIHVVDVLQSTHAITTAIQSKAEFTDEDKLSLFLAACIHDYEHRGLSNDFLKKTNHEWVSQSDPNATSGPPNEIHHAVAGLELLNAGFKVLDNCDAQTADRVTSKIREIVLATDMECHSQICSDFQAMKDDPDRTLLLKMVMKVSDLGHAFAPWQVHQRWASQLEQEFWAQGDKELQLKLSVSSLMDRTKPGVTKSQAGFFDFLALPLLSSWTDAFPECFELKTQALANKASWAEQSSLESQE